MNRSRISPTLTHYLVHYPFTGLVVLSLLIGSFINPRWKPEKLVNFWALTLFRTLGMDIDVSGKENIHHGKSRVIVLNHASLFDIPAIMTVLPAGSFIGRSKLLSIPLFGRVLKILGYIPIDTHHIRQSMDALDRGISGISAGRSIIVFPEGTRTLDGELLPFKRGFVRILRKSGADLQPVTLRGFYSLKSKYSRTLSGDEPLSIVIHRPVRAEELTAMSDREIIDRTRGIILSAYK